MPKNEASPAPLFSVPFLVWGAFVLALAVRVLFALQWHDTPYGAYPLLDAQAYHDWAQRIAGGEWFRARAFYQSPLYPYLLGALYALTGPGFWVASLAGALLDAGTVALLTLFAARSFGRTAALTTALLGAFYRPAIFYTAPVMKEPLCLFLLALFILIAFQAWQSGRKRAALASGFILGLAALTRGNVLALAPVWLLLVFLKHKGKAVSPALLFVAALGAALAPATIHNAVVSHAFVPVNYADGFNLYIGHSPYANGANAYPPEVSTDPVREELNVALIAQKAEGRTLNPAEISTYWRGRAIEMIRADPWREIRLLKNKIEVFWNAAEKFDNYDVPFIAAHFDTLLSGPLFGFGFVAVLAAFAALPALRQRRAAALFLLVMAGAYFASVLPFYVTDRYRLPVEVFLLPLAGAALPLGKACFQKKETKRLTASFALAALFAFLAWRDDPTRTDLRAFDWGTLATIQSNLKQDSDALAAFEKGRALSPVEVGPQAYVNASISAQRLGDNAQAQKIMQDGLTLFPNNSTIRYNQGRNLAMAGRIEEARNVLAVTLQLDPSYVMAHYAMALVLEKRGDLPAAEQIAREGLALDPSDKDLQAFVRRTKK